MSLLKAHRNCEFVSTRFRVKPAPTETNYFECPGLDDTEAVDENAFCECTGDYLCSLGSDEEASTVPGFRSVRSLYPPNVHASRRKRDASPIYSDDIAHDYVPPVPWSSQSRIRPRRPGVRYTTLLKLRLRRTALTS